MIKITTDSTCGFPTSLLERYKIPVFPLGVVKGGRLFRDGENIHTADIAAHVDAGGICLPPTQSMPQITKTLSVN